MRISFYTRISKVLDGHFFDGPYAAEKTVQLLLVVADRDKDEGIRGLRSSAVNRGSLVCDESVWPPEKSMAGVDWIKSCGVK